MRILHLGKYYPPHKGGMETVLRGLCEAHSPRAEVVALVANERRRSQQEEIAGVKVIRAACIASPFSVPIVPDLPRLLRRIPADVLVHHEPNPGALLSYLIARPQVPLVIWFHSDIVRQRAFYAPYRPLLRLAMQRATAIVVASPNLVRYTPLLQEFDNKCCVIPFGIDPQRFVPTPKVEARAAAIRAESPLPIILFVGRFAYYKGLTYLIEAMGTLRARLILVGSGPLEEELRSRAATMQTPGTIEFTGELSEMELCARLHACDVFVLPSVERSEAFGVVQLEAMACGKPVVSTNLPTGVPWVNQHGLTGIIVPPRDLTALAHGIRTLLEDPDLRKRLGDAGRARVEYTFTISQMSEAFWDVLAEARQGRLSAIHRYRPDGVDLLQR